MNASPHDHGARLRRFRTALRDRGVDVAIVFESRNQYYLSGVALRGAVVVPADGDPVHLVQLNVERARSESAVDDVRPSRGRRTTVETVREVAPSSDRVVGVEMDVLPVGRFRSLREALPAADWVDVADALLGQRRRKEPSEVAAIEAAARVSETTLAAVGDVFEPGTTELELKAALQRVKRREGAEDGMVSRAWNQHLDFGVLASGPNTAVVSGHWVTMTGNGPSSAQPYGAGHRPIRDGDVVVVDHGTVRRGYHSDEARTFVVGGPTPEQEAVHDVLVDALDAAVAAVEPGRPISAVYDATEAVAEDAGYADEFMARDQVGFEYVGHAVGLDIDEGPLLTPRDDSPIEAGMVFAIEPKVVFAGDYGITLEDTVLATEDGSRRLTRSPRRLGTL